MGLKKCRGQPQNIMWIWHRLLKTHLHSHLPVCCCINHLCRVEDYVTPDSSCTINTFLPEAQYKLNVVTGDPCTFDGQVRMHGRPASYSLPPPAAWHPGAYTNVWLPGDMSTHPPDQSCLHLILARADDAHPVTLNITLNISRVISVSTQAAITLCGMAGNSEEEIILALEDDGSKPGFTANSSVSVSFKAADVGPLQYLKLRLIEGNTYSASVSSTYTS